LCPGIGVTWFFASEQQRDNPFVEYHVKKAMISELIYQPVTKSWLFLLIFAGATWGAGIDREESRLWIALTLIERRPRELIQHA